MTARTNRCRLEDAIALAWLCCLVFVSGCHGPTAPLPPPAQKGFAGMLNQGQDIELRLDRQGKNYVDRAGALDAAAVRTDPDGRKWAELPGSASARLGQALTVEAWVIAKTPSAEGMQTLVSKWAVEEGFGAFTAFDAGKTSGLETGGFLGAVFDGRYVYFVPQHDQRRRDGRVLRYDTHKPLNDPGAWAGYDAETTAGLVCRGYYGAAFDGRYVYFTPRRDGKSAHSRVLRYDTRGGFTDPKSWDARDAGLPISFQGCAFDGRYLYFCPGYDAGAAHSGLVLRYDTRSPFHDAKSWATHDAANTCGLPTVCFDGATFDGRYLYFAPLARSAVLRFDTWGPFQDAESWTARDVKPLGVKNCVGAVYDGKYVYLVPYGDTRVVVRYNTRAPFNDVHSWEAYDAADTGDLATLGYDGGAFDGRYVVFIPFWDNHGRFHANVLRYDTQKKFMDPAAWSAVDASLTDGLKTIGYNAGAFDGRRLYCAPWHDGRGYPKHIYGHGRVLACDRVGEQGSFSLRWADLGHNGGLCAAVPGPSFVINTAQGARSVAAHRTLPPGKHHLAGVYDGRKLRLYVDGALVAEREATGAIVDSPAPVTIGRIAGGAGTFDGTVDGVRISPEAKDAAAIRASAESWR